MQRSKNTKNKIDILYQKQTLPSVDLSLIQKYLRMQ